MPSTTLRIAPLVCLAALLAFGAPREAAADTLRVGGTGAGIGLLQLLGDAYTAKNPQVTIEVVPSLGTSGGLAALADGVIDIAVSARPLKPEEEERGIREFSAFRTPFMLVTKGSSPGSIASADIAALFAKSDASWPDGTPVRVVLRPTSETDTKLLQEFFPGMTEALAVAGARAEIPVAPTDQDNATLAEATDGSLASATLVQMITERRELSSIPIDGVEPTLDNLETGSYPYAKTLYFAIAKEPRPDASGFAAFLAGEEAASIMRGAGIVPTGS